MRRPRRTSGASGRDPNSWRELPHREVLLARQKLLDELIEMIRVEVAAAADVGVLAESRLIEPMLARRHFDGVVLGVASQRNNAASFRFIRSLSKDRRRNDSRSAGGNRLQETPSHRPVVHARKVYPIPARDATMTALGNPGR